jgi:hypothetical protein
VYPEVDGGVFYHAPGGEKFDVGGLADVERPQPVELKERIDRLWT